MKIGFPSLNITYDWISICQSYKKYVKKSSIVLEIGASNLEKTKQLSQHCHQLIGVELLPQKTPSNFKNVRYITGDWQNLTNFIKPKSIDIAVSSHVIEHVPDDLKALDELYQVLRPGAAALITTPNRKRLTRRVIEFFSKKRKFPHFKSGHVREYTEEDLIILLKKSLFKQYKIIPVVIGLHAGWLYCYFEKVPRFLKGLANFWEVHLFREN